MRNDGRVEEEVSAVCLRSGQTPWSRSLQRYIYVFFSVASDTSFFFSINFYLVLANKAAEKTGALFEWVRR